MAGKIWSLLQPRELEPGPSVEPSWRGRDWLLKRDAQDIAWLLLDRSGEKVNTLSESVLSELDECLGELKSRLPRGLVLRKESCPRSSG